MKSPMMKRIAQEERKELTVWLEFLGVFALGCLSYVLITLLFCL